MEMVRQNHDGLKPERVGIFFRKEGSPQVLDVFDK
jgi:hypothetical protein